MKYNIKFAESNAATGCSSVGWIDCFACGDRDLRTIRKPNAHDGQRSAACGGDSVAIRNFSDFLRLSGRAGHSVGSGGRLQSDVPCSESISEIWMLRR